MGSGQNSGHSLGEVDVLMSMWSYVVTTTRRPKPSFFFQAKNPYLSPSLFSKWLTQTKYWVRAESDLRITSPCLPRTQRKKTCSRFEKVKI